MSFQNKVPVQPPNLTGPSSPQSDLDSCLFCYVNIIPTASPFEEDREALLKRAHLLKNLLYHLGYSMAFLPEECQGSNFPVCYGCGYKINKMWFYFYEAMKIACEMRDMLIKCVAAGKRYVPKQENENFTKMREVIVHGALLYTCIPAKSDPQRFLQQVQKMVDYEALGSGNSTLGVNRDVHTENMRSTVEIAGRALGMPIPIHLFPASSSSTNVDPVAASVPQPPLSLRVPVASTSGLRNRNASPATTSGQSTKPSPFNYIECTKCQTICFTQRGFDKHLTECQPSTRPTTNGEQCIATSQLNAGSRQFIQTPKQNGQQRNSTSTQSSTPDEHQSNRLWGPRPRRFKCRICNKCYETKAGCRIHERKDHKIFLRPPRKKTSSFNQSITNN